MQGGNRFAEENTMTPEDKLRETCPYNGDCNFPECCSGECGIILFGLRARCARPVIVGLCMVWALVTVLLLAACSTVPPPRVLTEIRTVEVKTEVPVRCPPPTEPATQGADLAPTGLDDWETAQFIRVRLMALRKEITGLRAYAAACSGE